MSRPSDLSLDLRSLYPRLCRKRLRKPLDPELIPKPWLICRACKCKSLGILKFTALENIIASITFEKLRKTSNYSSRKNKNSTVPAVLLLLCLSDWGDRTENRGRNISSFYYLDKRDDNITDNLISESIILLIVQIFVPSPQQVFTILSSTSSISSLAPLGLSFSSLNTPGGSAPADSGYRGGRAGCWSVNWYERMGYCWSGLTASLCL